MKHLGITTVLAAVLSIGNLAARTFVFDPDLKIGFDAGTTGVGFTIESRINDMLGVRTGFNWIPHFEMPLYFRMELGDNKNPVYENGRSRFDQMAEKLEEVTGFKIDQKVKMIGEPNMYNFKLLIDIYPLEDKRWYFTTGFYSGSSVIGRASNCTEDMTKLVIAAFYNNIYENVYDLEYNDDGEPHGVIMGLELTKELTDKIFEYGRMGMHVGDYKNRTDQNGKPLRYTMGPGADNMVKAEMRVNSFKPYLGVGFNGQLDKKNDRFNIIFDCGVMFWGGHPRVYTHDGTEIVDDLININGQIAHYVDYVRPLEVFPVLNLSLAYRLFK